MGNRKLLMLATCLLVFGCFTAKKEEAAMKEAARIHNEAVALAAQLEKQLDTLATDTTLVKDSVLAWRAAIENWEKELIEVPGNENHDNNHAHHDHGKEKTIDLTAGQMLSVQQEMKKQLEIIEARINNN
jgi:hypothetical protein